MNNENQNISCFDGRLLQLIGWSILGFFITLLTIGICYPWALCMVYGWKINHTAIEGRRLEFNGKAFDLFVHWLLWLLLCIITLGIYSFWQRIALEKWRVKNTSFGGNINDENLNGKISYTNISPEHFINNGIYTSIISDIVVKTDPIKDSECIFKLPYHEKMELLTIGEKISVNNYWCLIKKKEGKEGWRHSQYLIIS
jgi:hypothetical protein